MNESVQPIGDNKIKTILLIDDDTITNIMNRLVIEKLVPESKVEICLHGELALDYLFEKQVTPDIIILDINMPLMNGWEFLDELVRRGFNQDIHMLTSSQDPLHREMALTYPFVKSYNSKPLDYSMFQNIVEASGFEIEW